MIMNDIELAFPLLLYYSFYHIIDVIWCFSPLSPSDGWIDCIIFGRGELSFLFILDLSYLC